jgi:hypothetical protein
MRPMKRLLLILCGLGALASAADLDAVHTVYVLSMARGMDQYLANHLTNDHVLQVVTDPKKADVILTDHLGESFQAKLETISPNPEPVKPADQDDEKPDADKPQSPFLQTPQNGVAPPIGSNSSFGGNKGMVFLVDAKSCEVVWSTYDPTKSSASKDMDRTASDIVSRLKKDLKKK